MISQSDQYKAYSKTGVNGHSQKDQKLVSNTYYHLMQVKSIAAEHSAILSTFIELPFVIEIFVLSTLSCRSTQVKLYYSN